MSKILLIHIVLLFGCAASWRLFHRGRARNGNLGSPFTTVTDLPQEQWFDQKLDHFDPSNVQKWKQRYFVNDLFYDPKNGPVFLMIGGEAEANPKWMVNGTWLRYAEKYNALCIMLEHRYYGKSHPVSDLSVKMMSYLSSEQALADLSSFIVSYSEKLEKGRKWIVFGGSYPGSLAAWMRLKYPHLVLGAVSSSGPVLAVADFKDYFQVVEEALATYDTRCVDAIREGTRQFTEMLYNSKERKYLFSLFELCDDIDIKNQDDVSNLYENLASNFAGVVQYNKDNRQKTSPTGLDLTIDFVCDIMTNQSAGREVDRLAIVNSILLRDGSEKCLDYKYEKMINEMRSTDWTSKSADGARQWIYQTCTEFGFFQTSTLNVTQTMFGKQFPVEFFEKQCKDIFGGKYDRVLLDDGIRRTNMIYGGMDLRAGNIVFVHGSIDPWHALGVTRTLHPNAPAIYIEGTAHCANMYPSSPRDLPQLKSARDEIERLIGDWLNQ